MLFTLAFIISILFTLEKLLVPYLRSPAGLVLTAPGLNLKFLRRLLNRSVLCRCDLRGINQGRVIKRMNWWGGVNQFLVGVWVVIVTYSEGAAKASVATIWNWRKDSRPIVICQGNNEPARIDYSCQPDDLIHGFKYISLFIWCIVLNMEPRNTQFVIKPIRFYILCNLFKPLDVD